MSDFIRVLTSFVMVVLTPILNLSVFCQRNEDVSYLEVNSSVKSERDYGEYAPEKYDITLTASNSVTDAMDAIEALREKGVNEHITIWFREGTYIFNKTLTLESDKNSNITFRAYPGEKVVFTSCVPVTGWKADIANGVAVWSTDVDENADFSTLFNGDTVLSRTRYPKNGFFRVSEENHEGALFTDENTPWEYTYGDMQFTRDKTDTLNDFRNINDVCVKLLHYWVGEISYLDYVNIQTNRLCLASPLSMKVREGDRYFLENVFEALNTPGEWYLDKTAQKLYYVPFDGESIENTVLYAPVCKMLIKADNVSGVSFEGIIFKGTDWEYPQNFQEHWLAQYGMRFPQAEIDVEGTLEISNADNINILNCDFKNLGHTAIRFNKCVKNSTVKSCSFKNIGASGIFIDGNNSDNDALITENITVTDNLIDGYGVNFSSAIGVLLTNARNCEVSNNEITDGRYTAISVGWTWGYTFNITDNIKIKNNLIYNIGQGWLSDMGGIYTLGVQPNSLISGNVIYNVAADEGQGGYGGWGIYLDEGTSYMTVEKNLVYNCGSQGFHQHYGEENIIRNNIFAFNHNAQLKITRQEEHNSLTLEKNIFVGDNQLMYGNLNTHGFKDNGNIYWDYTRGAYPLSSLTEGTEIKNRMYAQSVKSLGLYNSSVFENPLFKDAKAFDFTLPENSEVTDSIGFEKWDYSAAGTVSNFN